MEESMLRLSTSVLSLYDDKSCGRKTNILDFEKKISIKRFLYISYFNHEFFKKDMLSSKKMKKSLQEFSSDSRIPPPLTDIFYINRILRKGTKAMVTCQSGREYQKTKEKPFQYLVYYLQKHEEVVSVSAESQGIQRHTFYHHYKNLNDFYLDFIQSILDGMVISLGKAETIRLKEKVQAYIDYRMENEDKITAILKLENHSESYYSSLLLKILNLKFFSDFQRNILIFFLKEIDSEWLKRDQRTPKEELIEKLYGFIQYVISNF